MKVVSTLENVSITDHFEWLLFYIDRLDIQSLKPIIGHLFGEAKCPDCENELDVFDGVSGPLV